MSRRKLIDRPVGFHVRVPGSVYRKVHTLLLDPRKGRVEYGAMNALITRLLREWLEREVQEIEAKGESENG